MEEDSEKTDTATEFRERVFSTVKLWARTLFLMFNGRFDTLKNEQTLGYKLPSPAYYATYRQIHVFISLILLCNVLVGTISYMTATRPLFRYQPSTCWNPVCYNVTGLCEGYEVCQPVPKLVFYPIDQVIVGIFTAQFVIRYLTVWAVDAREANVMSYTWMRKHPRPYPAPNYSVFEKYLYLTLTTRTFVDIFIIVPYYANEKTGIFSVFRVFRIFSLIENVNRLHKILEVFILTVNASYVAIFVVGFCVMIFTVFFGSLMYILEMGQYQVTAEYGGAYLVDRYGSGWVPSQFTDIPASMYFVVTSFTTVGYGDITPTSPIGRFFACAIFYCGIIGIALPIAVISNNFNQSFETVFHSKIKIYEEIDNGDVHNQQSTLKVLASNSNSGSNSVVSQNTSANIDKKKLRSYLTKFFRTHADDKEFSSIKYFIRDAVKSSINQKSSSVLSSPNKMTRIAHRELSKSESKDIMLGENNVVNADDDDDDDWWSKFSSENDAYNSASDSGDSHYTDARGHHERIQVVEREESYRNYSASASDGLEMVSPPTSVHKNETVDLVNESKDADICSEISDKDDNNNTANHGESHSNTDKHKLEHSLPLTHRIRHKARKSIHAAYTYAHLVGRLHSPPKMETWKDYVARAYDIFNCSMDSIFAIIVGVLIFGSIIIAIGFYVASTIRQFQYYPSTCPSPACQNDPELCPGQTLCAPVPYPIFNTVETACVSLFVVDYTVRLFTCWAVVPKKNFVKQYFFEPKLTEKVPGSFTLNPLFSKHIFYLRYVLTANSIIDLLCIIPTLLPASITTLNTSFVRSLRILRLFRLMVAYKEIRSVCKMVIRTLKESMDALLLLFIASSVAAVFYGAVIYVVEKGKFTVTAAYPNGYYQTFTTAGVGVQESLFTDAMTGAYFVLVTLATVGYGDIVATTPVGRILAVIYMFTGVLLLSLPVGVIGSKFVKIYNEDEALRAEQKLEQVHRKEAVRLQLLQEEEEAKRLAAQQKREREHGASQHGDTLSWVSKNLLKGVVLRHHESPPVNNDQRVDQAPPGDESKE